MVGDTADVFLTSSDSALFFFFSVQSNLVVIDWKPRVIPVAHMHDIKVGIRLSRGAEDSLHWQEILYS